MNEADEIRRIEYEQLDHYCKMQRLIKTNGGSIVHGDEVRTIIKSDGQQIFMREIKEGDVFIILEPDGTRVGDTYIALSDGYIGDNGVWTVKVDINDYNLWYAADYAK